MDPDYKLIYSVDPTKIKVNIQQKFAKLTLSSNKKKENAEENKPVELGQLEKSSRVSRNLLEDLEAVEVDGKKELDKINKCINPILQSISSEANYDPSQNRPQNRISLLDKSTVVDVLELSDSTRKTEESDYKVKDNYAERCLSQKFSSLLLNSNPISISSSEDLNVREKLIADEQDESFKQHQTPMKKVEDISTYISSSEYDDEESSGAITISDSSEGIDYNLLTSDIPKSGETANLLLPNTFSNDKADRIEAYLRDVSQALKEMKVETNNESLLEEGVLPKSHEEPIGKRYDPLMADTESMPQDNSSLPEIGEKQHTSDQTESMSRTHTSAFSLDSCAITNIDVPVEQKTDNGVNYNHNESFIRCIAYDETVANTFNSNLTNSNLPPPIFSPLQTPERTCINNSILPDDSVIIPETDSELEDSNETTHISNKSPPVGGETTRTSHSSKESKKSITHSQRESATKNDQDLSISKEKCRTQSEASLTSSSSLQSIENIKNPNTVNISAKINIKIHISQQISSDEEGSPGQSCDGEESSSLPTTDHHNESDHEKPASTDNRGSKSVTSRSREDEHDKLDYQTNEKTDQCTSQHEKTDSESDEDPSFIDNAQKILTQLYGNSWQTPEVMRTLNKSRSQNSKKHTRDRGTCKRLDLGTSANNDIPINPPVEESVLDDFSIFRSNIKGNLNSTTKRNIPTTRTANTEKKCRSQLREKRNLRIPQTEVKKRQDTGRAYNERWRQLISDSDDDGRNASDDDEPDKTNEGNSSLKNSDKSWRVERELDVSVNSTSSSDEEYIKRKGRTGFTKKWPKKAAHKIATPKGKENKLVYLDLSKEEVEILEGTPVENNDENLRKRLDEIFSTNKYEDKPKLQATPTTTPKTKRKLFTADFGNENEVDPCEIRRDSPSTPSPKESELLDNRNVNINLQSLPQSFEPFNKRLEAVKFGVPIFKIQTPKSHKIKPGMDKRGYITPTTKQKDMKQVLNEDTCASSHKYGFLKSLDVCVGKSLCDPEALYYRDNFRQKKEELTKRLYNLYNEKLFGNKLDVFIVWNKKLTNTAGRCLNKKKLNERASTVELSEKVLTSADRLRCTLIHELCHAATWIFNGESGHGPTWKSWASKANMVFPEIPKIGVCHQYDIEYKYTYKCTLCGAKSHAHSKSKKVENIRCSYCHGAIEVFLNKKDKDGNIMPTPVREPRGFAKFVRDKYQEYKRPGLKHADVMKILSNEFALLKVVKGN